MHTFGLAKRGSLFAARQLARTIINLGAYIKNEGAAKQNFGALRALLTTLRLSVAESPHSLNPSYAPGVTQRTMEMTITVPI